MPQSGRAGYVEARETERDALGWAQVPEESPPHCAPPSSPPPSRLPVEFAMLYNYTALDFEAPSGRL